MTADRPGRDGEERCNCSWLMVGNLPANHGPTPCPVHHSAVAARPAGQEEGATCDGAGWCVNRDAAPLGEPYCNGAGRCIKGYASSPSSPVPDEVREEIALRDELEQILLDWAKAVLNHDDPPTPGGLADAILATTALRRLLDTAAAVERCRELADHLTELAIGNYGHTAATYRSCADRLVAALDGQP